MCGAGAVFRPGLAGTALAADTYTWKGGAAAGAKKWSEADNWEKVGGGNSVATDTARSSEQTLRLRSTERRQMLRWWTLAWGRS